MAADIEARAEAIMSYIFDDVILDTSITLGEQLCILRRIRQKLNIHITSSYSGIKTQDEEGVNQDPLDDDEEA